MINEIVLKELAAKWKRDSKPPEINEASTSSTPAGNSLQKGVRIGLQNCADDLLKIIELLGGQHV